MGRLLDRLAEGRPYFIAEMSANHANDLSIALSIVDAASSSGADCLKVQTYTAATMTIDCDSKLFRIEGGLWDGRSLYELYDEASFPWEWHEPVKQRCIERGIDFLSTPFDRSSVDFLSGLGVEAFKIASFELVDTPLIEYAAQKGKPLIISCGMASLDEITEAVQAARKAGNEQLVLLKCCSDYPADPATMNLSTIVDMRRRFGVPVGLSDHSQGHAADVVAASLGACVIEKHFCLSRDIDTADSAFSMTPDEYKAMVDAVDTAARALGQPTYGPSESEKPNLAFRRSIFAVDHIDENEPFTSDNIRIIRPSYGAKPKYYDELLGRPSDRPYEYGDPIVYGD